MTMQKNDDELYVVETTDDADNDIESIDRGIRKKAIKALLKLEERPYKGHGLKGSLLGCRALEFSLPGGEYRAIYIVIESEKVCLVFMVAPHENIYDMAERRFKSMQKRGLI